MINRVDDSDLACGKSDLLKISYKLKFGSNSYSKVLEWNNIDLHLL